MPGSDKEYEIIIKYLDGNLDEEEKFSFDQLMENSEEFRKELRDTEEIIATLKVSDRIHRFQKVKEAFTEFESEHGKPVKNSGNGIYWLSGIAASLALLILGYLYFFDVTNQANSQELYAQYYEVFPLDEGSIRNEEADLATGLQLYMKAQYSEAIPYLEDLIGQNNAIINSIYLSNAYLKTQEFEKAEQLLRNLDSQQQNTVMNRYTKWYLSLTLLVQDKIPEAKESLKELSETSGIYQEEASEILIEVE